MTAKINLILIQYFGFIYFIRSCIVHVFSFIQQLLFVLTSLQGYAIGMLFLQGFITGTYVLKNLTRLCMLVFDDIQYRAF